MRALVREILARRMPEPPAEFVALQVNRLNEALLVAHGAMWGANLGAVDRVVKIVRELDRYHGFFESQRRSLDDAPRLKAPAEDALGLDAPLTDRLTMAPQAPEMIASAPENGMAAQVLDSPPQGGAELASLLADPDPLALAALVTDHLLTPKPLDRCHARERGHPESPADGAVGGDIAISEAVGRLDPRVRGGDKEGRHHAGDTGVMVASKWRRKRLKSLNPRPEMASPGGLEPPRCGVWARRSFHVLF